MNSTITAWIIAALCLSVLGVRHVPWSRAREELRLLSAAAGGREAGDFSGNPPGSVRSAAPSLPPGGGSGSAPAAPSRSLRKPALSPVSGRDPGAGSAAGGTGGGAPVSPAAAAYLGGILTLSQLRACTEQSGFSPEAEREFRAVAAAAKMGADGAERLDWVLEACRTPEERGESLARVVGLWAPRDMNDAGQWLDRQPPGPEKDAATAAFAREVVKHEPPAAVEWALNLTDPGARDALVREIMETWRARDPEAAGHYPGAEGPASPGPVSPGAARPGAESPPSGDRTPGGSSGTR